MGNTTLNCAFASGRATRAYGHSKGKVGKAFFAYSLLQVAFIVGTCWREGRKETKKKNTGEKEKERKTRHMSGRMSRGHYLPQADWRSSMMLSDFLDADDLSMLEEKPLVAEKNEGFKNMLRCQAVTGCLVSAGISLLCVPSTFCCERIYQGSSLVLDANKIEFSQPTPSACVLANLKRTVPLENITDVTVEDDCILQAFGLKKIMVQTAGTGGIPMGPGGNHMPGVQAIFAKEPELWKAAINHAHALKVQTNAPGGQNMSRKNAAKATEKSMMYKIESLRLLVVNNALTQQEADEARVGLMLHPDDLALTLLGMHGLKCKGQLTMADFAKAKKHFLEACKVSDE